MMKTSVTLLLVSCLAITLALKAELNDDWQTYKTYHGKVYKDVQIEAMRREIWETHLEIIQTHNLQADRGVHTYWMGENEFTDLTNKEFRAMMNGYLMTNRTSHMQYVSTLTSDPPAQMDWRTQGYVTPIKNQEQCGSCWAFSTTGSLEGQNFKKNKKLVSLSEQNLVDCSKKYGNKGCKGGLMDNAFKYIKANDGIDTEESYPYKGKDGVCKFKSADVGATDTGFVDVKRGSEDALLQAVAEIGPISVAMDAGHQSFQHYRTGVYKERECSSIRLDHGVLAVGYGEVMSSKVWIVKNSWGTTWGEKGYFNLARDDKNMCGIATQASYPLV